MSSTDNYTSTTSTRDPYTYAYSSTYPDGTSGTEATSSGVRPISEPTTSSSPSSSYPMNNGGSSSSRTDGSGLSGWAMTTFLQTKLLIAKNVSIARVSRRSTIVQLIVPVVAIVSLWVLAFAYEANQVFNESAQTIRTPGVKNVAPYPRCISGPLSKGPCISIAWVLTNATQHSQPAIDLVQRVVERIRAGANIPTGEVVQFASSTALDDYLLVHPNSTQGAYIFEVDEPAVPTPGVVVSAFRYAIQYNKTETLSFGIRIKTEDYTLIPMTAAVEAAAYAELGTQVYSGSGAATDDLVFELSTLEFARPEEFQDNLVAIAGPIFVFAALLFNFIILLGNVVVEKEFHLRTAMRLAGLRQLPYWLSWGVTAFMFNFASVMVLIVMGAIFQFRFFLDNDFRTYFFLFLLFAIAMVPLALLLSVFVSKSSSATSLGFLVFLAGSMAQVFQGIIYGPAADGTIYPLLFSFVAPVVLSKGMFDIASFSDAEDDTGMTWSQRSTSSDFPLTDMYGYLIMDFFVYTVLLWYFDTYKSAEGQDVPFYFPLLPRYWCGSCMSADEHDGELEQELLEQLGENGADETDDPNVLGALDDARASRGTFSNQEGLRVYGLRKEFVSRKWCGLVKKSTFVAVRELVLGIPANTLVCLLGSNGAGKSTSFNLISGLLTPTSGDAFLFGHSIRKNMDTIRKVMGVCPQHDVLWSELTAREHVRLYAQLKGIRGPALEQEITERLSDVALLKVADQTSGSFSGGMRRRLSIALAYTGDPKFVLLDEPTTGADPVSRRQVWNLIERKKRGRITILTTHSMEEADVLGDEITIMSAGRLVTQGTTRYLKSKFGIGARVTILPRSDRDRDRIADFVAEELDGILPMTSTGDMAYLVPIDTLPRMPKFLKDFERVKDDIGAESIILSATSLEEVFLRVRELYGGRSEEEEESDDSE